MRVLFLDIATHTTSSLDGSSGAIACVTKDGVASLMPIDDRMNDADLLPVVEAALTAAGWAYADLTHITCVVGPGGFTSLRMGVSLANALADQLKIPAAAVHLSDLYRARAGTDDFLWIHSTKKTELFVRGWGALWPEATLIGVEEFHQKAPHGVSMAGELIVSQREVLADLQLTPAVLRPLDAVLPSFLADLPYKSDLLLPWYGRTW